MAVLIAVLVYFNEKRKDNAQLSVNTSTDETASWKTYRNGEYGFEFSYPKEIEIRGNFTNIDVGINLGEQGDDKLIAKVTILREKNHLEQALKNLVYRESEVLTQKDEFFNNIKWKYIKEKDLINESVHVAYLAEKDNYTYILSTLDEGDRVKLLDQILSTFKFIGTSQSECVALGGRWGKFGLAVSEYCDLPPWDQ